LRFAANRSMNRLRFIFLILLCLPTAAMSQQAAATQPARARKIETPVISDALNSVLTFTTKIGTSPLYEVTGDQPFSGQALAADTIVFKPGSQLRFVGGSGDRSNRYIVAQRIIVQGSTSPPRITWASDDYQRLPPTLGKAGFGHLSGSEGVKGGSGEPGTLGNPGYAGRNAPTVYVVVGRIQGAPIIVDLRGQDGGTGGQGQAGGDGGPGRSGEAASNSVFGCSRGGGDGGDGGDGGNGGNGGTGGAGGSGGTLIVVGREGLVEELSETFLVNLPPGNPGPGGEPGPKGIGGPPGEGGSGNGFCSGGHGGKPGHDGIDGKVGVPGPTGEAGVFAYAPLTFQQMRNLGISPK
jgi:hypothetical protein